MDPTTTTTSASIIHRRRRRRHGAGCDESRCVSRGRTDLYNDSFTCYGDGDVNDGNINANGDGDGMVFPMMCADGFLPRVIEDEPSQLASDIIWVRDSWGPGLRWSEPQPGMDIAVRYFTCCPPDHPFFFEAATASATASATNVTRRCSDPITAPVDDKADDDKSICKNQVTRKHPRRMKRTYTNPKDSFLCCDSILPIEDSSTMTVGEDDLKINITTATNFLDHLECVPYCDQNYGGCKVRQDRVGLGIILYSPISCNNVPDREFIFPRPIGTNDTNISSAGWYHCCKTGPALPPFVQDTAAFRIETYTWLAFYSVAAAASLVVVIGLLLPLLIQLKNGSYQRAIGSYQRASGSYQRASVSYQRAISRRSGGREKELPYSTYNLYVVYLAVPDLGYNLFIISAYGGAINQNPFFSEMSITAKSIYNFYVTANLWINAIVCYQLLVMLRNSHHGQRTPPPSLTRVNLQCGAVYFLSATVFCVSYFLRRAAEKAETDGVESAIAIVLRLVALYLPFSLWSLSIVYVIYVSFVVWWRGYIPSTTRATPQGRATRQLAFYFFRIVAVFVAVWTPSIYIMWFIDEGTTFLLIPIQAIATTCAILSKEDVRIYIWKLVTLSYLFGNLTCRGKNSGESAEARDLTEETKEIVIEQISSQEAGAAAALDTNLVMPGHNSDSDSDRIDDANNLIEKPGINDIDSKASDVNIKGNAKSDTNDNGNDGFDVTAAAAAADIDIGCDEVSSVVNFNTNDDNVDSDAKVSTDVETGAYTYASKQKTV